MAATVKRVARAVGRVAITALFVELVGATCTTRHVLGLGIEIGETAIDVELAGKSSE